MVKFEKKKITQCRECPHCRIVPDPSDWFNDDDEKAFCREAGHKLIENMLRPYERIIIPDWCPLRILELKA